MKRCEKTHGTAANQCHTLSYILNHIGGGEGKYSIWIRSKLKPDVQTTPPQNYGEPDDLSHCWTAFQLPQHIEKSQMSENMPES